MERIKRLKNWFNEVQNHRKFAFWNIWIWFAQFTLIIPVWFFAYRKLWDKYGVFYLVEISIIALWLSALSWWQSTRVEERQIDVEEVRVEERKEDKFSEAKNNDQDMQ